MLFKRSVAWNTHVLSCNHHDHPALELFSSSQVETLFSFNTNSPSLPPPSVPGTYRPPFCLCGSDFSRDLQEVESYHVCPFVTGLFHLATMSSRLVLVVASVRISFLF